MTTSFLARIARHKIEFASAHASMASAILLLTLLICAKKDTQAKQRCPLKSCIILNNYIDILIKQIPTKRVDCVCLLFCYL